MSAVIGQLFWCFLVKINKTKQKRENHFERKIIKLDISQSLSYLASTKSVTSQVALEAIHLNDTVVSEWDEILIIIIRICFDKLRMSVTFTHTNRIQAAVKWSVLNWNANTWLLLPARTV